MSFEFVFTSKFSRQDKAVHLSIFRPSFKLSEMSSKCNFDRFCFMCTYFTAEKYKVEISVSIMKMFKECYEGSMINLDSNYSPNIICKICHTMMTQHLNGGKSLSLVTPARWRDPRNHPKDCFSCNTSTEGANHAKRKGLSFAYGYSCSPPVFKKDISANLSAEATSPAANSTFCDTSTPKSLQPTESTPSQSLRSHSLLSESADKHQPDCIPDFSDSDSSVSLFDNEHEFSDPTDAFDEPPVDLDQEKFGEDDCGALGRPTTDQECLQANEVSFGSDATSSSNLPSKDIPSSPGFKVPASRRQSAATAKPVIKLNQHTFNDFCRQFIGGKKSCASVGKFFNDHGILEESVDWTSHLQRETSLSKYFDELPDGTPFCKDVDLLIEDWFEMPYDANEYRLFMDSGKGSLKAVLLSNGGHLKSLPLLYSTTMKESQADIEKVLECVGYFKHNWSIVCDLKMVGILLGELIGLGILLLKQFIQIMANISFFSFRSLFLSALNPSD